MLPYRPGPHEQYLVKEMSESEEHLLEVVNKLAERFDSYDKRMTVLSSNISKVKS
jgi:hypothetical protein